LQAIPIHQGYRAESRPLLRVVSNEQLDSAEAAAAREQQAMQDAGGQDLSALAGFVRGQFEVFRSHRDNSASGWSHRLLHAMRTFNGEYDPEKLSEIRKFGGSEVFARIVAMKARGASSLLRDVYLSSDRPWALAPDTDPEIPAEVKQSINQLIQSELAALAQAGQPIDQNAIHERLMQLMTAARTAAKKRAQQQAQVSEEKLDDILSEGGFYRAIAEFITDLPLFPYAVMKGPVVRIVPTVVWQQGQAITQNRPRMFWTRVSPFDIWWTPGVADIEDASVIERTRVTRADLNDLLDLPGFDHDAVREVLDDYGRGGLEDNWDMTDAERAVQENRENPQWNRSGLISCLEYHGNVQGRMLLEYGMDPADVPDPLRDYFVQVWVIGRYVIKAQLSPSPRKRHPYFVTSFEKVPGTPVGNGLPDILSDIQDVTNATLRSLVNNLSIASGPQVVINVDRIAPEEDAESLYPWKRWMVTSDPVGNTTQKPVDFFQPGSNAQELLGVFQAFSTIADDLSAIPRFINGQAAGAAARTASGLAMLMGNASKILQTVAMNIDRDVLDPSLGALYDMVMLTDTSGLLTGQETVRVMGVTVAVQKETQRSRQLEFLQITANPMDAQIVGPKGRASVLRAVSETLGLNGQEVVPSDDELDQQQKQAQALAAQQGIPGHGGFGGPAAAAQGGQQGDSATQDTGPREKVAGGPQ
jgi:hypothetical protein